MVTVNTIPAVNPIPNSCFSTYNYIVDPQNSIINSKSTNSNTVYTKINDAIITSTKKVIPTNCVVGDTIFYTITLSNSGNATANDIVFIDTIPNGTSFVANSLKLNNITQPGQSPAPPSGFNVGSLAPGALATIAFNVIVNTIPNPNPIPNSSYTTYDFLLNTITNQTVSKASLSNKVSTYVNADSNPLKAVDKQYASIGDTLTYVLRWQNKLNVTATNVTFIDTIPNDTTFINGSITVNGVTVPSATITPPNGLNVGTLPSGGFTTVTFNVLVNTLPSPNPILNQAIGLYSYISDPTLGLISTETTTSNFASTQINYATIPSAIKKVNKNYAKVGDILTYTISFTNSGNVTASNVTLIDTIPTGASFNINSVYINNVNSPGDVVEPPNGLSIGDIAPKSTTTVSFSVTIITIPSPNVLLNNANIAYDYVIDPVIVSTDNGGVNTNTVSTTINYANLSGITKFSNKAFLTCGDTITYTFSIPNSGNVTATNVILVDTLSNGTSFVANSVYVNGSLLSGYLPTSITIPSIAPGGVATVSFKVIVNC